MITRAPWRANPKAVAAPSPVAAPVIKTPSPSKDAIARSPYRKQVLHHHRRCLQGTAAQGHEDLFSWRRLSDRCRFGQGTFARTRGNGRDAPIPVVGVAVAWRVRSTGTGPSPSVRT